MVACNFASAAVRLPIVAHALGRVRSRLAFAAEAEKCLRGLDLDVIDDMGSGWYCDLFMSHDGSRLAQWEHKLRVLPAWLRPVKRLLIRWAPPVSRFRTFRAPVGRAGAPGPGVVQGDCG